MNLSPKTLGILAAALVAFVSLAVLVLWFLRLGRDQNAWGGFRLLFEIPGGSLTLKDPYGVALDSAGRIYVSDAGNHRVLVFEPDGTLAARWDSRGSGPGQFESLGFGGIAIDGQDNVFVVDNGNHRIQKFDRQGRFLGAWGTEGTAEGQFVRALGIATDRSGNVYVTDDANPFVQKFDNHGRFLLRFGSAGEGPGQFLHATGIAVDQEFNVYVSDFEARRVQKFSADGQFLTSWTVGPDRDLRGTPEAIAVDARGVLYVSDYALGRVQLFDPQGRPLATIGVESLGSPLFRRPTGLALGPDSRLLVVQQAGHRVSVLGPQ